MAADLVVLLCLAAAAAAVEGEAGAERPRAGGGFGMGAVPPGDPLGTAGPAEGLRAAPVLRGSGRRSGRGAAAMRCRSPPHLLNTAGPHRASRIPSSALVGQRTSALAGALHVGPGSVALCRVSSATRWRCSRLVSLRLGAARPAVRVPSGAGVTALSARRRQRWTSCVHLGYGECCEVSAARREPCVRLLLRLPIPSLASRRLA